MKKTQQKELLRGLFVPRNGELEGVCFALDYLKEENEDKHAIQQAVSRAQRDSGLSFDFSYQVAEKAVDVLRELEDWDDDDAITEAVDQAVPIYTGEVMEIMHNDWHAVDEVREEMGAGDSMEREAAMAWYHLIETMVCEIRENLKELQAEEHMHEWGEPKEGENKEVIYWCKLCDATKDSDGGIIE